MRHELHELPSLPYALPLGPIRPIVELLPAAGADPARPPPSSGTAVNRRVGRSNRPDRRASSGGRARGGSDVQGDP